MRIRKGTKLSPGITASIICAIGFTFVIGSYNSGDDEERSYNDRDEVNNPLNSCKPSELALDWR